MKPVVTVSGVFNKAMSFIQRFSFQNRHSKDDIWKMRLWKRHEISLKMITMKMVFTEYKD